MDGLEAFDLDEPIICADYDLEEALKRENDARLAREASGMASEEDDLEVEEATSLNAYSAKKPAPPQEPTAAASPPLTGKEKKKQQKRTRDRAKRKATTIASLSSPLPPLPSPRVLQKATESIPLSISFSAEGFWATKQRWTGLNAPLDHPLLPHADDPDFLKKHMRYIDWAGEHRRIIGILVPPPVHPGQWAPVVEAATAAMRAAREKMSFPPSACSHRRGGFPAETDSFAFGGGRQTVGNVKPRSAQNRTALEDLLQDKNIQRMATYPIPVFQTACFQIFSDYHQTKQALLRQNPYLRSTFPRSPFAAVTVNLGPASVSPPHTDGANKADGMCLIGALGSFDADKGGHIVCWDYDLIIRFPRRLQRSHSFGRRHAFQHTHSRGRGALLHHTILRWRALSLVANGFQTDLQWYAHATADDVAAREADRRTRCATALKKFSRWKDLKVKNFSGRSRVEVWDAGDIADFSDLTEEGERSGGAAAQEKSAPSLNISVYHILCYRRFEYTCFLASIPLVRSGGPVSELPEVVRVLRLKPSTMSCGADLND
ncbi:hypothetical protein B0H14DRAFT_3444764 [Mycena olivaceomarginata]|nr:hypothetical protein B0H14DRAFT_3444764 [Mycena olivaceomarginata]